MNPDLHTPSEAGGGWLVRPATAEDDSALLALIVEMQEYERGLDPRLLEGRAIAAGYLQDLKARCATLTGEIFVAVRGDAVIGFVAVQAAVPHDGLDQPPGVYALVSDLSVSAPHRQRGVGRALLSAAEAFASGAGATELRIAVLADNEPADHLYRSFGFRPYLHIHWKHIDPPGVQVT